MCLSKFAMFAVLKKNASISIISVPVCYNDQYINGPVILSLLVDEMF